MTSSIFRSISLVLCVTSLIELAAAQSTANSQELSQPTSAVKDHAKSQASPKELEERAKKLALYRERSAALLKQHVTQMSDIASGKLDIHAELRKQRPKHIELLAELKKSLSDLQAEKDPEKQKALAKALYASLQVIGPFLEDENPNGGYVNTINQRQQDELRSLEAAFRQAKAKRPASAEKIEWVNPDYMYTLTHLSVPLVAKAVPGSMVYFTTEGGGFFTNQLPTIGIRADEQGFARTEWITRGGSYANTPIAAHGTKSAENYDANIRTVQLKLRALPPLPSVAQPVQPSVPTNPLKN